MTVEGSESLKAMVEDCSEPMEKMVVDGNET